MKQMSFNRSFLLKNIKQTLLIVLFFVFCSIKLYSQQIINNGGTIVMSGAAYMVVNNASFINNGTFTAGKYSNVVFSGSSAFSVGTTLTSIDSTNFYNLYVTNTAAGTINPYVGVKDTISVTAGTLNSSPTVNAVNLTLLSSLANTANVSSTTIANSIIGNVNVQRYIPAKRAWRLLTAPVSGTSTISATWQNSGLNVSGYGMFITGPGAISSSTPSSSNMVLDYSPKNTSSMKSWDYSATTPAFVAVANTGVSLSNGTTTSADNKSYFVFVRGDRLTTFNQYSTPNITTLNSIGKLQTGLQNFPASMVGGNFTLIGNPYAAPVDFTNVTRTNLVNRFYAWDPLLNTVGGYVVLDSISSTSYSISPSTGSSQTKILQSGQAFFVQSRFSYSNTSIVFNEANKSNSNSVNSGFKPLGSTIISSIAVNLYLLNTDSSIIMADGNLTQFNNNYSDNVSMEDALKFTNVNENLGILRHGVTLAIESRPNLSVTDTLFLNLSRTTQRAYQFQFVSGNLEKSNLIGYLQDKYLNTSTEISLTNKTPVNFTVDGNAASAAADRFQIVFKTVLPFSFTKITAAKNNSNIAIEWKVAYETDIAQYEVEKSTDGISFIKVKTTLVTGNNNAANNYIWLDENAQTGDNIYRVKMLGKDGSTKYTENVKVAIVAINTSISIYPNPIKEGKINIQMGNQPSGTYLLSITNNNGQVIYTGTIQNNSSKSNFLINLNSKAAKGIYNLQITTPQNKITTQKLIVE